MSTQKPYLSEDGNTLWLPYALPDLLSAIERTEQAPAPEPPPGYTLSPGDDPAVALADLSAGDTLWLADATFHRPIHLHKSINVRGLPGSSPMLSGWTLLRWDVAERRADSTVWVTPYNRFNGRLTHRIVTNSAFLAAQDGPARLAAHNAATRPELVAYDRQPLRNATGRADLTTGSCWYDEKDSNLYACLPAGSDLDLLEVAQYPQLFTAADGVAGITVEGFTITGAANTHKQGAFELHSDGNTISNVTVQMVNSLGYSLRGIGLNINDAYALDCGQMGHWLKIQKSTISIIHERSNWRGSDAGWHASNKFEQSIDNDIAIYARQAYGVGCWFDVGNHRNRVSVVSDGCHKNALMVEHYADDNTFLLDISGTRPIGRWEGADIQIQSNVKGNTFTGDISGNAVPYWLVYKTAEGRGPSGPNTFTGISASGRPHRIEGGRHEKDIFEDIT